MSLHFTTGLAPPGVNGLSFVSVATSSTSSVRVTLSWKRPSDRNGSFMYQLKFVGVQPGIYRDSNATVIEENVKLKDTEEMYVFGGLPGAQYSIWISAINYKTGISSPETSVDGITVSISKS